MTVQRLARNAVLVLALASLSACGGFGGGLFRGAGKANVQNEEAFLSSEERRFKRTNPTRLSDLFGGGANANTTLEVNRYIWAASLEVLNFLPIESVDPFSGVIVTGYGTPPGGGRAYRATVLVQDPALDARSLKLSLQSKGGAVDPATVRAVEDAILTRARQLRVQDGKL
ncbi:DUF3576 domain-containing protein [Tabrizicola oligotrophica]|uniref:DUF3576 domain-containing protein n=1 Tax=Tabrizicola oligotrophica TaxID=2710650 RepID=A0A6M0QRJ3_9RHOB|nr:DUF3576 domain-containing protein [Tabrizicola oligotrophica]NEY89581.1 DUF3576 domain-containing protein [Tabrizicola oligotrophica]